MSDDLLSRLRAARSEEERAWLVTLDLLDSLPPELQAAVCVAAIPHWFEAGLLAALLEQPAAQSQTLYAELQKLPFVEPFEARKGHNVHEVTRAAMLDHLWREQHDEYVTLSARAAAYFAEQGDGEPERQIEHIYHMLIAEPEIGVRLLKNTELTWYDSPNFAYDLVYALAETALEHDTAGRLDERSRDYANFWSGVVNKMYDRDAEARPKLESDRQASGSDKWFEADYIKDLATVHVRLSEYPEARARYEEARPIYQAIGDKLGVANCISALGDVHVRLSEYLEAQAWYEQARPIYQAIGSKLGEANCDFGLGAIAREEENWSQAEQSFQIALGVYRELGMPFNIGLTLWRLGAVAEGKEEPAEATNFYRESLQIFEAIGVKDAEYVREDLQRVAGSEN